MPSQSNLLTPMLDDMAVDNLPAIPDDDTALKSLIATCQLTTRQGKVLVALTENLVTDDVLLDTEIAEKCDVTPQYVSLLRRNPRFARAMTAIIKTFIAANVDVPVQNLYKLAKKDVKANEILLRISELYQPTNRNLNINASVRAQDAISNDPAQVIDGFLIRLGTNGWSAERLTQRFNELKDEGAF